MKKNNNPNTICPCCMEEHEIISVRKKENTLFKGRSVSYEAYYTYCKIADEYYANEQQITANDLAIKNAFRKTENLLTTDEIASIRHKYIITQSDLCTLLGWGGKTITRYEGHQVQDRAHDRILKKLDQDPEWFISLLKESKESFNDETFQKYLQNATAILDSISSKSAERKAYARGLADGRAERKKLEKRIQTLEAELKKAQSKIAML